jgi:hypothetical protein
MGPEQINKWRGRAIDLTSSGLVVVVQSGMSPASGSGEAAVARPRSPEIW